MTQSQGWCKDSWNPKQIKPVVTQPKEHFGSGGKDGRGPGSPSILPLQATLTLQPLALLIKLFHRDGELFGKEWGHPPLHATQRFEQHEKGGCETRPPPLPSTTTQKLWVGWRPMGTMHLTVPQQASCRGKGEIQTWLFKRLCHS